MNTGSIQIQRIQLTMQYKYESCTAIAGFKRKVFSLLQNVFFIFGSVDPKSSTGEIISFWRYEMWELEEQKSMLPSLKNHLDVTCPS